MEIIFFWFVFALLVGAFGSSRTIGFWASFLLSIILSPLIGFIIALLYRSKDSVRREQQNMAIQLQQTETLKNINTNTAPRSVADELSKIAELKEKGHISEEEYQRLKAKII